MSDDEIIKKFREAIEQIWEISAEALRCEGEEDRSKYSRDEYAKAMAQIVGIIDDLPEGNCQCESLRKRWEELDMVKFTGVSYEKFGRMTQEAIQDLAKKDPTFKKFLDGEDITEMEG